MKSKYTPSDVIAIIDRAQAEIAVTKLICSAGFISEEEASKRIFIYNSYLISLREYLEHIVRLNS